MTADFVQILLDVIMLDVAEFVQKLVTLFLGPSGRHIADIQNLSGAKIQVSKKVRRLNAKRIGMF